MNAPRTTLIVLVLTWIASSIVPTRADECPGPGTLEQQFARSQAVFVGRAIAQQVVPTNQSVARGRATETTFEVEEIWKGQTDAKTQLRVQTCGWTDANPPYETITCGGAIHFVIGLRYVVFAGGDPLEAGCAPAQLVDRATDTLVWLSRVPRK